MAEKKSKIKELYSKENLEKEIREKIEKKFGKNHDIKLALLKVDDNYNDETYDYQSLLILINSKYEEIEHNIHIHLPNDDEQYQLYEEGEDYFDINDITIKF